MRPPDHDDGESAEPSLFEHWMGLTSEQWDALGQIDDDPEHG